MQTTLFSSFGTAYTDIPLHLHVRYQNILRFEVRVGKITLFWFETGYPNSAHLGQEQHFIVKTRKHRTTILTIVTIHGILPTNDTVKTALLKVKVHFEPMLGSRKYPCLHQGRL